MALKLPEFITKSDAKSRIVILIAGVALVGSLIYVASLYLGGADAGGGKATLANAPSGLQSVPGSQLSPEYYRALTQANSQATKQAQINGTSAVPTLINTNGQGQPSNSGDCKVLCQGEESANVNDDLNNLVKLGKLTKEDAAVLSDLAKNNVSDTEYEDKLNALVKSGKLTPEEARKLLATYKKQHANAKLNESGQFLDAMIQSGKVPLDVANNLLALQKAGISPSDYSEELNRLVREGKISPETAAQLLAQYSQQRVATVNQEGAAELKRMAQNGQISPEVGQALAKLQQSNASVDDYKAELNRLVAAGKMTPETAAKLLRDYQNQRTAVAPATSLSKMLANSNDPKLAAVGKDLLQLQANNASVADYAQALSKAVESGALTPDQAAKLLQEYQALKAPGAAISGGLASNTNLPANEELAKLQQRLRAQQADSAEQQQQQTIASRSSQSQQFAQARSQTRAQAQAEEDKLHQQRLQQLMTSMSNQSQALIASWATPSMEHRQGQDAAKETLTTKSGLLATNSKDSATTGDANGEAAAPLVKAGTIYFAVLDTAVDSDYPNTPVLATIVNGKLKGAKVMGKLALETGQDKVSLTFNLMDSEEWTNTKPINAFAIDPDTAKTVMANDVNYHYMLRYGSLFASSFISGYASAITSAGSTTTTSVFGSTTAHPELSPASRFAVGLGQVGTNLGTAMSSYFNTPATVKVNAGVSLGILFMADVVDTKSAATTPTASGVIKGAMK